MRLNLRGKLRNTRLPETKALFPLFEAVVNAFHAVEDAPPGQPHAINVTVERDYSQNRLNDAVIPRVTGFTVTDNGVGFTDENVESFFTSDSEHKLNKGGKGLGRFLWLVAFDYAAIESHYYDAAGRLMLRKFRFSPSADVDLPLPAEASDLDAPQTTVRLVGMRQKYRENCPQSLALIGHRIAEHCVPFFLDPTCPSVTIRDESDEIDLNRYFREHFEAGSTQHVFDVGGSQFRLRGLRLHGPHETHHRLVYAAHSREVLHDKLEKHLPNLQRKLSDENGAFVYLGFLEGEYLDRWVDNERTGFKFPTDDSEFYDVTLASIRAAALPYITKDLEPFLTEINTAKRATINQFINEEAPQYRPLRRYLDEFIDEIPPGASGRALEMALHEQLYEKQRELKTESTTLLAEAAKASLRPDDYEAKLNDFIERSNELGKSSLAEYVAHRKVMLEFLESSLRPGSTGKYPLEEIVHRIIYPMKATSDEVPYEQQNLWIIDERLAYHDYLASDLQLRQMTPLSSSSQSRPDIAIFDNPLAFSEGSSFPLTSLVVIEFKRPLRDDYRKEDPLQQVTRLIREIQAGHFKDKNGREIKAAPRIPSYGYVICDITKELEIILLDKGMTPTPNGVGFFSYNQNFSAYIEVVSYDKLLDDAKKRNRVLFDKLHLPT